MLAEPPLEDELWEPLLEPLTPPLLPEAVDDPPPELLVLGLFPELLPEPLAAPLEPPPELPLFPCGLGLPPKPVLDPPVPEPLPALHAINATAEPTAAAANDMLRGAFMISPSVLVSISPHTVGYARRHFIMFAVSFTPRCCLQTRKICLCRQSRDIALEELRRKHK